MRLTLTARKAVARKMIADYYERGFNAVTAFWAFQSSCFRLRKQVFMSLWREYAATHGKKQAP